MATVPDTEPWAALLETGRTDERLVHDDFYGARSARLVSVPEELNASVSSALHRSGITHLYAHQADALYAAFDAPTIITTGTASGKSLCFQLPTLELLTSDRTARALYLYPTKALAQDQARAINAFGLHKAVRPAIYDGDTPRQERAAIRKRSNLIITNPDMLHVGILPHHPAWGDLFANLAFVVVDEAHVYRGVFGSHVANVLRRLRRIAAIHGSEPRFLLASATIANPLELARAPHRRPELHPDRQRHRSQGGAAGRALEPAVARRVAGPARLGAVRGRGGIHRVGHWPARGRSAS